MDAVFADVGPPKNRPSRARWSIFLGLLAHFTALTYLAVSSGSPGDVHDRPVTLTTLATITAKTPPAGAVGIHSAGSGALPVVEEPMPLPRFRIRMLMIVVAVAAGLLALAVELGRLGRISRERRRQAD